MLSARVSHSSTRVSPVPPRLSYFATDECTPGLISLHSCCAPVLPTLVLSFAGESLQYPRRRHQVFQCWSNPSRRGRHCWRRSRRFTRHRQRQREQPGPAPARKEQSLVVSSERYCSALTLRNGNLDRESIDERNDTM